MTSQAKPKGVELVERINSFTSDDRKNTFLLESIKKEAKILVQSDPARAYMILGMLSCFENDMSEVHSNHQNALKLSPSDYEANLNYAQSLHVTGYFSKAKEYAEKIINKNPIGALNFLIKNSMMSCRFSDVLNWIDEYKKINPQQNHENEKLTKLITFLFKDKNIIDDDVEHLQKLAYSLLHKNEIYFTDKKMGILEDEESRWLSYMILMDEPVSRIVDLNEKLAKRMADENLSSNLTSSVVIMYSSAS